MAQIGRACRARTLDVAQTRSARFIARMRDGHCGGLCRFEERLQKRVPILTEVLATAINAAVDDRPLLAFIR